MHRTSRRALPASDHMRHREISGQLGNKELLEGRSKGAPVIARAPALSRAREVECLLLGGAEHGEGEP